MYHVVSGVVFALVVSDLIPWVAFFFGGGAHWPAVTWSAIAWHAGMLWLFRWLLASETPQLIAKRLPTRSH